MTIVLDLPNIASMRSITFAAAAAAAATGTFLVAGCGPANQQAFLSGAAAPVPSTTATGPTTSAGPATTNSPIMGTEPDVSASPDPQLPVSVESDSQMKAAGNDGPSSSILLPTSCRLTGTTVTVRGTYTNGGFVPNVYGRYGDIIVLYVRAAPSPGYADGMQLAVSDVSESPVLGSSARWRVTISVSPSVAASARCVLAAQPTHDGQFAP